MRIPVLSYYRVENPPSNDDRDPTVVTPARFARQVGMLASRGFTGITIRVLGALGWRSTTFAVSTWVGQSNLWDASAPRATLMDARTRPARCGNGRTGVTGIRSPSGA